MSSINRDELRLVLEFYRNMGLSSIYMDEFRDEKSGKTVGVEEKTEALEDLRENIIGDCRKCRLHEGRKNIVFGEGNPDCEIMFIGEGPGADEDIQGRPFVGKAGQLLTNLIKKMGSDRNDVYIANIVKCRPPGNRNPLPDEARTCMVFLKRQIEIISPKVIMVLGNVALQNLLGTDMRITKVRGKFHDYNGIKVMPTFHPSYLLRSPKDKWLTWEDAVAVLKYLGKEIEDQPAAGRRA